MRVDTLTPVLDAAPGELVIGRVRVVNDGPDDASFTMRVVGLDGNGVVLEVPGGPIGPGLTAEVDVPLDVPAALGVGHHAVALEVASDRPDDRPALAQLTVSIDSLERVQLTPRPSTVRAGRNGRFTLDVVNHEHATVDVALAGEATDVAVRFDPPTVRLHPGERGWVRGRIKARQRWGGDSVHHVLTLTARGRSSTTSTTMAYIQRPLVPGRARNAVAALVVVALFLGLVGGGLWWWSQRDTGDDLAARQAGTGADGVLDSLDGAAGTGTGGTGAGGGDGDGDGADRPPGPGAIPMFTVVTGTVSTADGDASGVSVRIAPIDLGDRPDSDTQAVGMAGRSRAPTKIWSARHATQPSALGTVRATESVDPITTDGEGVWRFVDIPIRQNYELVFAKPGHDTKSFVVTPPDDGSRVELDVELEPGSGQLSGVVVGPDGPLGGVDIVVTDGTLTFRTTSATEASGAGQVGSFAIEGMSTPAVYTLTASLRGFGTEVLQLPLGAGQERSGVTVAMHAGVGSISGRITTGGEPRGGVTITASNGDDTFTTTSFTEGDVGFYSIPRLAIPDQYTVTASLPGYISQTRRIDLAGNVGSADYELVSTTAGITGRVMSSEGGAIVGAGITVSVDELFFRSSTAAAPVAGSFNIEDLPPGTYLVRIARFDHLPFSQQVTVGAGEVFDLGTITLTYSERPPIAALGSVAVRVFDSEDSDLDGATVSLYPLAAKVGVDPPLYSATDEAGNQSTFVFENVPVGTYRVRVTRPIYRTVERRVSVGLGRENVEVRMLRLGQASGQIVDSVTGDPLRDYEISIFRIDGPNTETFIESRPVLGTAQADEEGKILWESAPNSLITGLYRLVVTRQPPGYQVEPNQVIDPTVTVSPASMLFLVPPDSEDPVVVNDLVADPYPLVGGRLFTPQYNPATGSTTMRVLEPAEVDALENLEVTLTCGEATGTADTPPVRPSPIRPTPGFDLPITSNHYEFTPFQLQAQELVGSCQLAATADGYLTTTVDLTGTIAPQGGAARPERTVNFALLRPADPLFGKVFWRDGNVPVPADHVRISTNAQTVVGSLAEEGETGAGTPLPDRARLSTTSDELGRWQLDGQLFGRADYTFSDERFTPGVLRVILDDAGDPTTAPERTIEDVSGLVSTELSDGSLEVELTDPEPGPLSGSIEIITRRAAPAFALVGRVATGPGATVDPVPYSGPAVNGRRPISAEVNAGTWTVAFAAPDNHRFGAGEPASVQQLVEPLHGTSGFDTGFVELGLITLDIDFDDDDFLTPLAPLPTEDATYELRAATPIGFAPVVGQGESVTFDELPVDADDPIANDVVYELDVTRPGFDETAATIIVEDRTDGPSTPTTSAGVSSVDQQFPVGAGNEYAVTVKLPQFGTLTGTVHGVVAGPSSGDLPLLLEYEEGGLLEITATRLDADGDPLTPDPFERVTVSAPEVDGTSFVVSGPPGTYEIAVSHPHYEIDPISAPVDNDGLSRFVNTNTVATSIDDPWVLEIKRSRLDLTALGSFGNDDLRVPIEGARVELTGPGDDTTTHVGATDGDGNVVIAGLLPGVYQLEVRRFENFVICADDDTFCVPGPSWSGRDIAYPVKATVVLPQGDSIADRTLTAEVKLPSLTGTIAGTIIAVNSDNEDIDDPQPEHQVQAPSPVTVTRSYEPSPVELVTGGTLLIEDNTAVDADVDPVEPLLQSDIAEHGSDPLESPFGFTFVPGGVHNLEFTVPAGYVLDENPLRVPVDEPDSPDSSDLLVVYRALDVTVRAVLTYPASVPVAERKPVVTFNDGDGNQAGADPVITHVPDSNVVHVTIADVRPHQDAYDLTITDALNDPRDANGDIITGPIEVTVVPNGTGDGTAAAPVQVVPVPMAATRSRLVGTVQQQLTPSGGGVDLQPPARIVLELANGTFVDEEVLSAAAGEFEFVVDNVNVHRVRIEKDDFVSTPVSVTPVLGNEVAAGVVTAVKATVVAVTVADTELDVDDEVLDGTTVIGYDVADESTVFQPSSRDGTTWRFTIAPATGLDLRFRASRPGHYSVVFPPLADDPVAASIGASATFSTSRLITRAVTVAVSGVADDDITVTIAVGNDTDSLTAPADGTTTFRFDSTEHNLPLTGEGTLTVTADGYRTQTFTIPDVTSDVTVANPAVDLRTDSFQAAMQPTIESISGALTGVEISAAATVFATDGTNTVDGVITLGGEDPENEGTFLPTTYSIEGTFAPANWTVHVHELGVGGGSRVVEIDPTSPAGDAVTGQDITVAVRQVTVAFDISGAHTTGATVWLLADDGEGGTTSTQKTSISGASGSVSFTVAETEVAGSNVQVRSNGRIWSTVAIGLGDVSVADPAALTIALPAVALVTFPQVAGSVHDPSLSGQTGVNGVAVELRVGACPGSALAPAVTTTTAGTGNDRGGFTLAVPAAGGPAGTYCVVATEPSPNSRTASATVTIPGITTGITINLAPLPSNGD